MNPVNWGWGRWILATIIFGTISWGAHQAHQSVSPIASLTVSILSLILAVVVLLLAKRVEDHINNKVELNSFRRLYDSYLSCKDNNETISRSDRNGARDELKTILTNLKDKKSPIYKKIQDCIDVGLKDKSTYKTFFAMLQKVIDYINEY